MRFSRPLLPFWLLTLSPAWLSAPVLAQAPTPAAPTTSAPMEQTDDGSSNTFNEAFGRQIRLDYSFEPEADIDDGGGFTFWETQLSTPLFGKKLGDNWIIGARLRYRLSEIEWTDQALFDGSLLHRIDLSLALVYRPRNSPWNAFISAGPALAGDFSSINSDDLLFVAIAGAGYRFSERFTLLAGAYFSQDFGEPLLLPGPGFIWTPSPKWSVSLIPPRLRIAYAPNDDWRIAAEAFPNGGRWNVRTLDGEEAFLDRSGARAGLRIERRVIGENGWLNLSAGWVFARDLVLETTDDRMLFDSNVEGGAFVAAGFAWRF